MTGHSTKNISPADYHPKLGTFRYTAEINLRRNFVVLIVVIFELLYFHQRNNIIFLQMT